MITILTPGFFSTIQDEGRWGYQAYGMPVAGAMDRYAYRIANLLVGNKSEAAVIEMNMVGASLKFDETQLVAICGADMQATLDGRAVPNWSSLLASKGSELRMGYAPTGFRGYLAIRGGIDVPRVLGSRSTYTPAKIGGLEGRALQQGDVLDIGGEEETEIAPQILETQYIPAYEKNVILRVLLGPQEDMFTAEAIETFFGNEYMITDEADRIGYRLNGPKITHMDKAVIVSDASPFGAVQISARGLPLILMADRQTTGGYAKIGTVIGPDLSKLAQAKPGDHVQMKKIAEREAVAALRKERQGYLQIISSFHKRPDNVKIDVGEQFRVFVNGSAYDVAIRELMGK